MSKFIVVVESRAEPSASYALGPCGSAENATAIMRHHARKALRISEALIADSGVDGFDTATHSLAVLPLRDTF